MSSFHPKISVVTVTFNAKDVLERTIRSVLSQTYAHIEYILVDGKSEDGTIDVIKAYSSAIDKLVIEPDQGLYDAMNKGIQLATGAYICFLNAGDTFFCETTLSDLMESIPEDQFPDVMYGETALVNRKGEYRGMRRLSAPKRLTWKSFRSGMVVCHQAFFARTALVEPYDLSYRFSSDFDWCIRVMKRSGYLHNSHLILINYLDEGLTTKNRKASLLERFRIMAQHYGITGTVLRHLWFTVRWLIK